MPGVKPTCHEKVEAIPDKALVAGKVHPALLNCLALENFFLGQFRTKGDTPTEDDAGILFLTFIENLIFTKGSKGQMILIIFF